MLNCWCQTTSVIHFGQSIWGPIWSRSIATSSQASNYACRELCRPTDPPTGRCGVKLLAKLKSNVINLTINPSSQAIMIYRIAIPYLTTPFQNEFSSSCTLSALSPPCYHSYSTLSALFQHSFITLLVAFSVLKNHICTLFHCFFFGHQSCWLPQMWQK